MKVTTYETLYHEDHGATLKHKCGKRIVALSLLSFSLIFLYFGWLLWPLFFIWASLASFIFHFVWSLIPTCGGIIAFIILSSLGQCSNNEVHHTFIDLQLKKYNSKLEQNMTLYECLRWYTGICNESRATCMKIMKVALPQIRCQLHDHAKSNMTMMERVIINGTVESCMAIYLGMAMEMP